MRLAATRNVTKILLPLYLLGYFFEDYACLNVIDWYNENPLLQIRALKECARSVITSKTMDALLADVFDIIR